MHREKDNSNLKSYPLTENEYCLFSLNVIKTGGQASAFPNC